jgi:RNAse (barnase) inhibitor barstar
MLKVDADDLQYLWDVLTSQRQKELDVVSNFARTSDIRKTFEKRADICLGLLRQINEMEDFWE